MTFHTSNGRFAVDRKFEYIESTRSYMYIYMYTCIFVFIFISFFILLFSFEGATANRLRLYMEDMVGTGPAWGKWAGRAQINKHRTKPRKRQR